MTAPVLKRLELFLRKSHCMIHGHVAVERLKLWIENPIGMDSEQDDLEVEDDEPDERFEESYSESEASDPGSDDSDSEDDSTRATEVDEDYEPSHRRVKTPKRSPQSARRAVPASGYRSAGKSIAAINYDSIPAVTNRISGLKLNSYNDYDSDEDDDSEEAISDERIVVAINSLAKHVGQTARNVKEDPRSPAAFLAEVYKYLTPRQQERGIVYILKHNTVRDVFKIGFSSISAAERMDQRENCYSKNTSIVYQSSMGHFLGAHKAERLAHKILNFHNVRITGCEYCGGGHREYYIGTWEEVLSAVQTAEFLMRMPAYERVYGGQWRLTDAVHDMLSQSSVQALLNAVMSSSPSFKGDSHAAPFEVIDLTQDSYPPPFGAKKAGVWQAVTDIEASLGRRRADAGQGSRRSTGAKFTMDEARIPQKPRRKTQDFNGPQDQFDAFKSLLMGMVSEGAMDREDSYDYQRREPPYVVNFFMGSNNQIGNGNQAGNGNRVGRGSQVGNGFRTLPRR
ncbi:hypothetical protein ACHAQH_006524 [Verticillium albo-atrum]